MTNAEIKSYREYLGLSIHNLAKLINVTHQKINSWENADKEHLIVPVEVAKTIMNLDKLADQFATELIKEILNRYTETQIIEKSIVLYRFESEEKLWQTFPILNNLPISFYMKCIFRAKKALEINYKCKVRINYLYDKNIKLVSLV